MVSWELLLATPTATLLYARVGHRSSFVDQSVGPHGRSPTVAMVQHLLVHIVLFGQLPQRPDDGRGMHRQRIESFSSKLLVYIFCELQARRSQNTRMSKATCLLVTRLMAASRQLELSCVQTCTFQIRLVCTKRRADAFDRKLKAFQGANHICHRLNPSQFNSRFVITVDIARYDVGLNCSANIAKQELGYRSEPFIANIAQRSGGVPSETLVLGSETGSGQSSRRGETFQVVAQSISFYSWHLGQIFLGFATLAFRLGGICECRVSFCCLGSQAPHSYATPIQRACDGVSVGMQRISDQEMRTSDDPLAALASFQGMGRPSI